MARLFSVAFDVEFTEDVAPAEAAAAIAEALDFSEVDHSTVFVQEADEVDSSAVGEWVGDDEELSDEQDEQ